MPEQISRYYESLENLDTKRIFTLDRNPILKIDWGANRVLTEADLIRVATCFVALPGQEQHEKHAAYNYYIGGITFLSLNDIHWQCEIQAFGNFYESLKEMMKDASDWKPDAPFEDSMLRFLDEFFPGFDERDRFAELCRKFEKKEAKQGEVTLKEASFIKLFCDAYFMRTIQPAALKELEKKSPPDKE